MIHLCCYNLKLIVNSYLLAVVSENDLWKMTKFFRFPSYLHNTQEHKIKNYHGQSHLLFAVYSISKLRNKENFLKSRAEIFVATEKLIFHQTIAYCRKINVSPSSNKFSNFKFHVVLEEDNRC